MKDLERLFITRLREIYEAEHQLAGALAEVEYYATSRLLKLAVRRHLNQTEKHAKRLEQVFKEIGASPTANRAKVSRASSTKLKSL